MAATKSTEQKKAETEAKEQEKQAQADSKAEATANEQVAAAASAADVEAKATAAQREQERERRIEETRVAAVEEPKEFGGQAVANEFFTASTSTSLGRETVEIKPVGWVGPGFIFPGTRIDQLKKLVGQLKHLPKQD